MTSLRIARLSFVVSLTIALSASAFGQAHEMRQIKKTVTRPPVQRHTPAGHIEKQPANLPLRPAAPNLSSAETIRAKQRADRGEGALTGKPSPVSLPGPLALAPVPLAPTTTAGTFAGLGWTGNFPPDGALAAGPRNLVHAVNSNIAFYSKVGTLLYSASLGSFFGASACSDPKVVFNPYVQRFFATEIACPFNHVLIAISNAPDATQGWHVYNLDVRPQANDDWCDYPTLGFSATATYVSCNMFTNLSNLSSSSFHYASVNIFDTSKLVNGSLVDWEVDYNQQEECFTFLSCAVTTIQPARMYGASSGTGGFLINARGQGTGNDHLEVYRVTNELNCCDSDSTTRATWSQNNIGVGSYDVSPSAPQPSGVTSLDTGDTRLLSAFWQNGQVAVSQNLNVSGGAGVAFTRIAVSAFPSMSVVNDWACCGDGFARYYASVDANDAGTMLMVFSLSNASTYAGAYELGIDPSGCCVDTTGTVMRAGASTYEHLDNSGGTSRNRWGDYFAVSRDTDGTGIWGEAEYVGGTNEWNNIIGFFYDASFPNPIPVLQSISPNSIQAGTSFNLFANGFDFVPGAVVQLNGVDKPTAFINSKSLEASVLGSDIPNDAIYAVNVFNPAPQGGFSNVLNLTVTPAGPPANDNYVGATVFNTPYQTSEGTTGATTESTDPIASCSFGTGGMHSVWFKYTATVPGTLTVSTEGSSYNTLLAAYTGSPGSFTEAACSNDVGEFDFTSLITYHVTAGVTYSIMVQSYNGAASSSGGTLVFAASFVPDNDSWSGRFAVLAPTYHAPAEDTTSAVIGSEDPSPTCGSPSGNSGSVWFNYTPTAGGMVFASTEGSSYHTVVSVWTGSPGTFAQRGCNDGFYGQQSMVPFYAITGTTYSIMVQSYGGSSGGNLLLTMNKQDLLPSATGVAFTIKQPVGTTSAPKTVTIKNQNGNTIQIKSASISSNFRLTTNTCTGATLAPGATCTLGAVFAPTNPGSINGSITVLSNANNYGLVIPTSGTAVYPLAFNVASVNFGTWAIGSTSTQMSAMLRNYTSASIPLGTLTVSPDFKASNDCGSAVPALSFCTFLVTFKPNRPVSTSGVVTVNASTSPAPVYLALTGKGSGSVTQQVTVTPALSWTSTSIGVTAGAQTATLKNTGATAITISSHPVYGPFHVTGGTCTTLSGGVLNPLLSCTFTVTFTPNAAGAFKGALAIYDTDATHLQIVNLAGIGVEAVTFSPASLSFGNVQVGTNSAPLSVTITNNMTSGIGSFGLALSGDYVQNSTDCPVGGTLGAKAVCHVFAQFQPITQAGIIGGSLAVSGSQPGSPQLLNLSGTGN